jgi:hypothetical protein
VVDRCDDWIFRVGFRDGNVDCIGEVSMSFVEIFNMNQKELDEAMDQMFLSYVQELDDARLNRELEFFNKEFDILMEMKHG